MAIIFSLPSHSKRENVFGLEMKNKIFQTIKFPFSSPQKYIYGDNSSAAGFFIFRTENYVEHFFYYEFHVKTIQHSVVMVMR